MTIVLVVYHANFPNMKGPRGPLPKIAKTTLVPVESGEFVDNLTAKE